MPVDFPHCASYYPVPTLEAAAGPGWEGKWRGRIVKVVVCMKQVPDTETRIRINPEGTGIVEEGVQYIVNPYDEFAVEEALLLKERFEGSEVVVITLGPERAQEALRTCFAMGADRGTHILDDALPGSDSWVVGLCLARALEQEGYDLILCGKQSVDWDCAHVGPEVAELLGIPHVAVVTRLEVSEDAERAVAHRQVEGGEEVVEVGLPALLTCQKGLNTPRYPTLKGIMGAKKKPIQRIGVRDLGLSEEDVGPKGARMQLCKMMLPPERPGGRIIPGEPEEAAQELVRLLRAEAKVI